MQNARPRREAAVGDEKESDSTMATLRPYSFVAPAAQLRVRAARGGRAPERIVRLRVQEPSPPAAEPGPPDGLVITLTSLSSWNG